MGNLLRLLARDDSSCCSQKKLDFFLDFENASPSKGEELLYHDVSAVLTTSRLIIQDLQQYKGAAKEIREAISDPGGDSQRRAWMVVTPLVMKLHNFYIFSHELEVILPRVLNELCAPSIPPVQHLETQQALVKQLAEILEFTLKFDELKHKEIPLEQTTETLGTMAKVCQKMLDNTELIARFRQEETQLFILRVMVALVILYDHVHPVGAFARNSHVDIKGCIRVLKEQPASSSENLLNALRYTTKHLNDENTPKHIRALLSL